MALKPLVEYIAKSLVDHSDHVDVNEIRERKQLYWN